MQKISKLIATVFYIGYSPVAPGTLASLAALPFCILLNADIFIYILVTTLLLISGFWSSGRAKEHFSGSDPRQVVIDEFSSMFLVFLFIPISVKFVITGFLLFRLLDIFKIPPIKKLESLPGGFGIMLDDMASAVLANLILQVLKFSVPALFS